MCISPIFAHSIAAKHGFEFSSPDTTNSGMQYPITLYAAGNEAKENGDLKRDSIYTTTVLSQSSATPTSTVTETPTPAATATSSPTPGECDTEISISPNPLKLRKRKRSKVTVTLINTEACPSEHPYSAVVLAHIDNGGKKRIAISPDKYNTILAPFGFDAADGYTEADENSQATFTITAKKAGKATVTFYSLLDRDGDGVTDIIKEFTLDLAVEIKK